MNRIEGPAYINVAIPRKLWKNFVYHLPYGMVAWPSSRVLVDFGNRKITGYVIGRSQDPYPKAKEIHRVIDEDHPLFPNPLLKTLIWASKYYHYPLGEVFRAAHPPLGSLNEETRFELGEVGKDILKTWPLLPPTAPNINASMEKLLEFFMSNTKAYKPNYLKQKGFSENLINRAVMLDILTPRIEVEQEGSKGTQLAVLEANLPKDEDTLKWLKRGPARDALLRELIELPMPISVDAIKKIRKNALKLIKDLSDKGLVKLGEIPKESHWRPWHTQEKYIRHELTQEQQEVLENIVQHIGNYKPFLLQGITGSGKTEIYLRVIEEVIKRDLAAIVLVPEISITPQLASRFESRFPGLVSVLHSGLTDAQRAAHWRLISEGTTRIVVGARSGLFAPMDKVGVIVVDEEHDSSFKQEDGFRYNARDLSFIRAKEENALLILGSATPSMETRYRSEKGFIKRLILSTRPTGSELPEISVIDMRRVSKQGIFSGILLDALKETIESNNQAILFVNRRGFYGRYKCSKCGYVMMCPNCSVALVQHHTQHVMMCHYCGFRTEMPKHCPVCGGSFHKFLDGTEKVVSDLKKYFSYAKIARIDSDTTRYGALEKKLSNFRDGKVDILVGTQIVTKGHDFPKVTLVGVLDADLSLYIQDFRASERTFQLLVQVAGRAGRRDSLGKVVIQTYNPSHHAIRSAIDHDTESFFRQELAYRMELGYPPIGRLVLIKIASLSEKSCMEYAFYITDLIKEPRIQVLGPVQAPIYVVRKKYRWQILLKSKDINALHKWVSGISKMSHPYNIDVVIDVDPLSFS